MAAAVRWPPPEPLLSLEPLRLDPGLRVEDVAEHEDELHVEQQGELLTLSYTRVAPYVKFLSTCSWVRHALRRMQRHSAIGLVQGTQQTMRPVPQWASSEKNTK